jgi:magnesium transporter
VAAMIKVLAHRGSDAPDFVDPARLAQLLEEHDALIWVDLEGPGQPELKILSDVFHFHPLTIEDCGNELFDPPKVDDYVEYLFIVAQAIDFSASDDTLTTTELDLYLGKNYVVTVHHKPLPVLGEVVEQCRRQLPLLNKGSDWLVHAILDKLVDQLLPVVEAIDEEIASLEDRALLAADRDVLERMGELKRSTLRLRWLVAPQRDMVNRLGRGDFPHLIREETYMYFRDIHDHLVRLDVTIENLRDLGESVMAIYLATQGNRLNEVMKALGIVGVIFLPLTLISGVFGTNFNDTYQDSSWLGFGLMCGSFLLIMGIMLTIFKKRRWI